MPTIDPNTLENAPAITTQDVNLNQEKATVPVQVSTPTNLALTVTATITDRDPRHKQEVLPAKTKVILHNVRQDGTDQNSLFADAVVDRRSEDAHADQTAKTKSIDCGEIMAAISDKILSIAADAIAAAIQGKPTECTIAPATIKDAIAKMRGATPTTDRLMPKSTPTHVINGNSIFGGGYIEWNNETGALNIVMGNKGEGITVTNDGKLVADKLKLNDGAIQKPHNIAGIPTTPNPLAEMSPRMILNPQIDVLPDFSLLNWTINVFNFVDRLIELSQKYQETRAEFKKREEEKREMKTKVL